MRLYANRMTTKIKLSVRLKVVIETKPMTTFWFVRVSNREVIMEFQQLEMFAAIVEEASIQRASERVFRTGPALSIALKKLEEEIGSPLFNKSYRNKYQLTPAGSLLY